MRSLRLAGAQLLRMLTGRRIVAIAVAVVLVVPLLYGALYLWAFWDPYAHIKDLPVAVVNEDGAVRSGDTTISAGADLISELAKKGTMRWEVMSASEASAALAGHRVYSVIRIPADFSARIASADTSAPVRALLTVEVAEADSMLASQIGARVFSEMRAAASAGASRAYFDAMWVGYADARAGLVDAANGAVRLRDGLAEGEDGSATLYDGLGTAKGGSQTLASGLRALSAGAGDLADGAIAADAGASTLATKLAAARDGAAALDGGARRLAGGLETLSGGLGTLAHAGPQLTGAATQLRDGASRVDDGIAQAVEQIGAAAGATDQLAGGSSRVDSALQAYVAAHPDAASDPDLSSALAASKQVSSGLSSLAGQLRDARSDGGELASGAAQVSEGAGQLEVGVRSFVAGVTDASVGAVGAVGGARTLTGGTAQLAGGMAAATIGADALESGTSKLAAGGASLAAGACDARTGSLDLNAGLGKLTDGASKLARGLGSAASGSRTLATGLASGVQQIPNDSVSLTDRKSAMMSDPVALDTEKVTAVANYGTGFAPYFIPLALWVGALVTFFVLPPVSGRALLSNAPDAVVTLAGYWPAALVGSAQAVILLAVVQAGLGLTLKLPLLAYALTALAALSFIALIQWLSFALGSAPGKLAGIVVLMLQLTSAAGTFPIETVPPFFQTIHPFLPMTYVVDGLRQAISGGDATVVGHSALALAAFLALGLAGTLLAVHRQRMVTMARLKPALEL